MTAALRAWGAGRLVLVVGAAVLLIETTATDQFGFPGIQQRVNGWSLLPALVAITMAEPLVDRSRDLTEHATRSPAVVALSRLALAHAGAVVVAGYCLLSSDGAVVASYVVVFLSLAACAAALLGPWYWVPLLPISFAWLQHAAGAFPRSAYVVPAPVVVGAVVGSGLAYLATTVLRWVPR